MKQSTAKICGLTISLGLLLSSQVLAQTADEKASRVVEAEAVRLEQLQASGVQPLLLFVSETQESDTSKLGNVLVEVGRIYNDSKDGDPFPLTNAAMRRLVQQPMAHQLMEDWYLVGMCQLHEAKTAGADPVLIDTVTGMIRTSLAAIVLIADETIVQKITGDLFSERNTAFTDIGLLGLFMHLAKEGGNETALHNVSQLIVDEITERLYDGSLSESKFSGLCSVLYLTGSVNGQRALLHLIASLPVEWFCLVPRLRSELSRYKFDPVLNMEAMVIVEQRMADDVKGLEKIKAYFEARHSRWIEKASPLEQYWMQLYENGLSESRRAIFYDMDKLRARALIRDFILNLEIGDEALLRKQTRDIEMLIRGAIAARVALGMAHIPNADLMWGELLLNRLQVARESYMVTRLELLGALAGSSSPAHERYIAGIGIEVMLMARSATRSVALSERTESPMLRAVNETLIDLFGPEWTAGLCRHMQKKLGINDLAIKSELDRVDPIRDLYELSTRPRAVTHEATSEAVRRAFPQSSEKSRLPGYRECRRIIK